MRLDFATFGMSALLFGVGLLGLTGERLNAGVVVEYDAATAAAAPGSPDWGLANGGAMTLSGGVLHQSTVADAASAYRAKETVGLMTRNTTDYTVEFTAKVILDTPSTDWCTNAFLVWGDDTRSYSVTLYKNGTTGGLKTGSGTTIGGLTDVVTGIDWSNVHQFSIAYVGATDQFKIYVDNVLTTTVSSGAIVQGGVEPFWRDRLVFGDYLTGGGGATQVDWTSVRLHDVAVAPVPEPATLGMGAAAIGGAMFMRRRR